MNTPLITFNNSIVYELTRVRTLGEVLELTLVPFVGEPLVIHFNRVAVGDTLTSVLGIIGKRQK